jgi:DNA-binding NtrC family response regulator
MLEVIVAEDEGQLRDLLAEVLAETGFKVRQAADGTEALDLLKANPGVSLLLSDIVMPKMNGYELVEEALKIDPELKVLMMTAYPAHQLPPAALKARAIRTLTKPFDIDRMCELVIELVGQA